MREEIIEGVGRNIEGNLYIVDKSGEEHEVRHGELNGIEVLFIEREGKRELILNREDLKKMLEYVKNIDSF